MALSDVVARLKFGAILTVKWETDFGYGLRFPPSLKAIV